MTMERKSLREKAKEFGVRLPFMDGKEKGEFTELLGQVSTITDYGFLPNEDGEIYGVFTVSQRPGKFYFASSILTERLSTLDADGYGDDIRAEGLPVLFTKSTSKKTKRTYTNVEFYPEG